VLIHHVLTMYMVQTQLPYQSLIFDWFPLQRDFLTGSLQEIFSTGSLQEIFTGSLQEIFKLVHSRRFFKLVHSSNNF